MYVELLLDAQVLDIATIHELWEGLRRVTFINILKYYMVWEIFVWEGVAVTVWSLGLVIVCLSSVPWCT